MFLLGTERMHWEQMGSTKVLLQSLRKKYSQQVFSGQTKARNEKF